MALKILIPGPFSKYQIINSSDFLERERERGYNNLPRNKEGKYSNGSLPELTALISLMVASGDINGLIKNCANLNHMLDINLPP